MPPARAELDAAPRQAGGPASLGRASQYKRVRPLYTACGAARGDPPAWAVPPVHAPLNAAPLVRRAGTGGPAAPSSAWILARSAVGPPMGDNDSPTSCSTGQLHWPPTPSRPGALLTSDFENWTERESRDPWDGKLRQQLSRLCGGGPD